ncbi:MAG: formylglycine-generating enzyme family protein [Clostridia bacterium]|nr:formylglycine-generating enzyme family protein [Clostridia bacterium]
MTDWIEIPELVRLEEDDFIMGDIWGDGDLDELPTYQVHMKPFFISKYTITNRAFQCFLNDIKSELDQDGNKIIDLDKADSLILKRNGEFRCKEGYEEYPVTRISWYGARAYCQWLGNKAGKKFKLPTECQWQYASMGPKRLKWALGDIFDRSEYIVNCNEPESAKSGKESDTGLFNVTGNVFEWCEDEYAFKLNCKEDDKILKKHRVIKGGAFILGESHNLRNGKRFSCYEASCLNCIGFRVVSEI